MQDMQIYAIILTEKHNRESVYPGNQLLIQTKDEEEQNVIMREIALAVSGDVVKLSNGMILIVTAVR